MANSNINDDHVINPGMSPGSTKVRQRSLMGCPSTSTSGARPPLPCHARCEAASISRDCPSPESKRRTSNRSMGQCSAALQRQRTEVKTRLRCFAAYRVALQAIACSSGPYLLIPPIRNCTSVVHRGSY